MRPRESRSRTRLADRGARRWTRASVSGVSACDEPLLLRDAPFSVVERNAWSSPIRSRRSGITVVDGNYPLASARQADAAGRLQRAVKPYEPACAAEQELGERGKATPHMSCVTTGLARHSCRSAVRVVREPGAHPRVTTGGRAASCGQAAATSARSSSPRDWRRGMSATEMDARRGHSLGADRGHSVLRSTG